MQSEGMIALAGLSFGIASTGMVLALLRPRLNNDRAPLIAIFALFGGLSALPLVVAFGRSFYVYYLPAMLPMLLGLPAAFFLYLDARYRISANADFMNHADIDAGNGANMAFDRRHAILPAAGLLTAIGYWVLPADSRLAMLVLGELPLGATPATLAIITLGLIFAWIIASFGYLVFGVRRTLALRQRAEAGSKPLKGYRFRWADGLMGMLLVLWTVAAGSLITDNLGIGLLVSGEVVAFLGAIVLFVLIAFSFSGAHSDTDKTKHHDTGMTPTARPSDDTAAVQSKYARSALSAAASERLMKKIDRAVREDRLYLDSALSLQSLSRHVGGPLNHVSQTLNDRIGAPFFDYIAHWRVEAAKPMLIENQKSVLTIAMDVGFNSRSTFYKAFKRETGMTPMAFKAAQTAITLGDAKSV